MLQLIIINTNLSVLEQIITAISEVEDTEPEDLEISIQNYISIDAINDLAKHQSNAWRLQFETPNHVVALEGDDTVLVDGEQH